MLHRKNTLGTLEKWRKNHPRTPSYAKKIRKFVTPITHQFLAKNKSTRYSEKRPSLRKRLRNEKHLNRPNGPTKTQWRRLIGYANVCVTVSQSTRYANEKSLRKWKNLTQTPTQKWPCTFRPPKWKFVQSILQGAPIICVCNFPSLIFFLLLFSHLPQFSCPPPTKLPLVGQVDNEWLGAPRAGRGT